MSFSEFRENVKGDMGEGSTGFKTFILNFIYDPSFRLLLNYRIGKFLFLKKNTIFRVWANYYRRRMYQKRNCQISFNSTIGKSVRFAHPLGVVIGDEVIIKDKVIIWQQVTLGSSGKIGEALSYPTIEKNVKIFAGAKIIGPITIGENSIIGANAVVLKNVPPNSIAVGVPAKVFSKDK